MWRWPDTGVAAAAAVLLQQHTASGVEWRSIAVMAASRMEVIALMCVS
jgi:hypothetical protein